MFPNFKNKKSGLRKFFAGAYILGPRIDRFRDAKSTYISGHSIPLIALGGFILIFGFMAFNGGSQGSISQVSIKTVINLQEKVLTH